LSDIHVDFAYTPGSQGDCSQPLCCRNGQPGEYLVGITTLEMIAVFLYSAPGHTGAGFW
jgi:hypothetical protein